MEVQLRLDLLSLMNMISIGASFILGLLLISSRIKQNKSNIFLGMFLLAISVEIVDAFTNDVMELEFLPFNITFAIIPLLFHYVIGALKLSYKKYYVLLFLPFVLSFFGVLPPHFSYFIDLIILFYTIRLVNNHQRLLGESYSDLENKSLVWLKSIVYLYVFFNLFWISEDILGLSSEWLAGMFAQLSAILTFFMIIWIGHKGFQQSEILSISFNSNLPNTNDTDEVKPEELEQTQNETIPKREEPDTLFDRLSQQIRKEKYFLQEDINIWDLSKKLGLNEQSFSKMINQHTNKNFYHYINYFRIEEFKLLVNSPQSEHLSILGIAKEAGFHSKSTFYNAFKRSEGMTPKQYYDLQKESE